MNIQNHNPRSKYQQVERFKKDKNGKIIELSDES